MSATKKQIVLDRPPVKFGEPVPDVAPPNLGRDIDALRERLVDFLEAETAMLKGTRDGQGLPTQVLLQGLMAGDDCLCRVVKRLLANE